MMRADDHSGESLSEARTRTTRSRRAESRAYKPRFPDSAARVIDQSAECECRVREVSTRESTRVESCGSICPWFCIVPSVDPTCRMADQLVCGCLGVRPGGVRDPKPICSSPPYLSFDAVLCNRLKVSFESHTAIPCNTRLISSLFSPQNKSLVCKLSVSKICFAVWAVAEFG